MLSFPILLALSASLCFALADFNIRFAMRHSTAYTGSMVQAALHFFIFGALALWLAADVNWLNQGTWWFLASGAADPGVGVICFCIGISRVGVARAASIVGTAPLFSTTAAMILLGERPNVWTWLGTVAIVVGVAVLTYEPRSEIKQKSGYIYAILGAVCLGLANPLRKLGLEFIPSTTVGLTIAQVGSILTLLLVAPMLPSGTRFSKNPRGLGFFSLSALIVALAYSMLFPAIRLGKVSVVIPFVHTSPLFVILLAWLFLRAKEKINHRLLMGALLIGFGAAAITGFGK